MRHTGQGKLFKYFFAVLFILIGLQPGRAQSFEFNERCISAYELMFSLHADQAEELLDQEKAENPDNLIPWFIDNYADFFTIYIGEDKTEFLRLQKNKDKRLDILRRGPKDSPYYLYTQAQLHLQWAMARLKFEEYFTAFREVNKAFKLLESNRKKFPDFAPNRKSLALLHAIIGAIPDQYKWGVRMMGMDGTIDQGMREMRSLLEYAQVNEYIFEQEAYVFYALMALYLDNDPYAAWKVVSDGHLPTENNLLNCFVQSSVAMRTGRNDYAIAILSEAVEQDYSQVLYLDFMLGLAKLRRLDTDADIYLKKFILQFKGRNYIRETYQKLAWHALLSDDTTAYKANMSDCLRNGVSIIDDDKQAEKEALRKSAPNPTLLKARLLFDGGYYADALKLLEGKSMSDFQKPEFQVEFAYRAGRIYDESGRQQQAIGFYLATLRDGVELPYFYAANAALHLGQIYEDLNDYERAERYYRTAIKLKNHEYHDSIQSKAKAGLNRLKQDR